MARSIEEALTSADRIGTRHRQPSFVIGGLAIASATAEDLVRQLAAATVVDPTDRASTATSRASRWTSMPSPTANGPHPRLLEHVERAASIRVTRGALPAAVVGEADQGLVVAAMARGARARVKGLVNAQFIVREDGVYLIEVNPRASRTVPFLSKVTGVPMVELAVRIALGASLEELGWPRGLLAAPPYVSVKAPAFSTTNLRGVDPSVGPSMQSTGEVIGIHEDPRIALAKALWGAGLVPPWRRPRPSPKRPGLRAARSRSRCSRSRIATRRLPRLAAALAARSSGLRRTSRQRAAIAAAGYAADAVAKLGAEPDAALGESAMLDLIATAAFVSS